MTSPDYITFASLLPTVEFLEYIANRQSEGLEVGVSPVFPVFYSSSNNEWICLNSESEFLSSPSQKVGKTTAQLVDSSAMFVFSADGKLSRSSPKSVFSCRNSGSNREVLWVTNFDRVEEKQTTAPLIDCFSRECLSWFDTAADWFIGLGYQSSLPSLIADDDGVITGSSSDILNSIITSSPKISSTLIELSSLPSSDSPFVSVCFGSGVRYQGDAVNTLFLYSVDGDDSVVAFASQFDNGQTSVSFAFLEVEISFNKDVIII